MHAMHMRAVEHTIRRGFCTHHAAWVNHTENRCILLVGVLTVSVLVLVPAQGSGLLGVEVLVVGLAAWGRIVAIQLPRPREWRTMRTDLRGPFVLRVVLGQVATLTLVIAGVAVLWVGLGGLYWLMAGTVFSILAALFEAWVLLVEINR